MGRARPGPASPAHTRRGEGVAAARGSRATTPGDFRGSALDRRRDSDVAGQSGRESGLGASASARELPARVRASMEQQDVLQPDAAGRAANRECRGVARGPPRRGSRHGSAQAAAREAWEPVFPRGNDPDPRRDEGAGRRARPVPPHAAGAGTPGPGHGPGDTRSAHRPAPSRGQTSPAGRFGRRQGRAVRVAPGDRRVGRRTAASRSGHLQAAEFLYETGLYPDLEYTFKHALTHEVTYGGLLQERRRDLHARIVSAIETLHKDRLGEQVERLAHHALRGEVWERAVPYLRQAGLKAAARSALPEAREWFEQALNVLADMPESPSTLEQGLDIRLELRPMLGQLGEYRRVRERLREAQAIAESLNDERRRGRVCAVLINAHSQLGELDEAMTMGARALQIAESRGDLKLRLLTTTYLEQASYF